jgi:hypothetical protein
MGAGGREGAGSGAGPQVASGGAPAAGGGAGAHAAGGGGSGAGEGRERGEELRQKVKAVTKGKSQTVRSSQRLRHSTLGREEWGPARHK